MLWRVIEVGIVGASGYTGAELLRLCTAHPDLHVRLATGDSQAGTAVAELYPSLAAAYPDLVYRSYDPADLDGLDLVFCGLPHGASQALMPQLRNEVRWVVDLAADFRLQDASLYPTWYGEEHVAPDLLRELRLRPARAVPRARSDRPAQSPHRGATRRRRPWPWPRWSARGSSSSTPSSSTP